MGCPAQPLGLGLRRWVSALEDEFHLQGLTGTQGTKALDVDEGGRGRWEVCRLVHLELYFLMTVEPLGDWFATGELRSALERGG